MKFRLSKDEPLKGDSYRVSASAKQYCDSLNIIVTFTAYEFWVIADSMPQAMEMASDYLRGKSDTAEWDVEIENDSLKLRREANNE